jgi:phenylacetate-CoA ligase
MDWYAPIARHITVPLAARLEGKRSLWRIAEVRGVEQLTLQGLLDLQWDLLRAMLRHAYDHTPFYRARFAAAGITPDAIRSPQDMALLPPLSKDDVRAHHLEMRAQNLPESDVVPDFTGGTTGKPMPFYRDPTCLSYRAALTHVFDGWYGKRVGDRLALVWGARQDYARFGRLKADIRNALLDRLVVLDASSMTAQSMDHFARALRRLRPALTRAYPRAMYIFAEHVRARGLTGVETGPIVATAEPLYPTQRRFIEEVFGRPVYDRYGAREIGFVATECPEARGMHWRPDSVFLESESAAPNEAGEMLVTDLRNYGMPLIRYQIGDMVALRNGTCSCGRSLPLLGQIVGRDTEMLRSTTGALVAGAVVATHVLGHHVELSQVQLIQEDLRHFTVRLVRDARTAAHEAYLRQALPRYLGADAVLAFELVDAIPREASGKACVVICRLPRELLLRGQA